MYREGKDKCGLSVTHTIYDAYQSTNSVQHRGREATGIVAKGNGRIDVVKWIGEVNSISIEKLEKMFPIPIQDYHTFFGHVRYATSGRKDRILEDAHPHVIGGTIKHNGDHVTVTDCDIALIQNGQVNEGFLDIARHGCDTRALLEFYKQHGEHEILRKIPHAYTLAIADKTKDDVMILRDRTGIKPGVLGWKKGYCVASEDIAFKENGGRYIEDLDPGSVYYIDPYGNYKKENIVNPDIAHCFFEWNYLAHVDSILNGLSVRSIRKSLGGDLADEIHPNADIITFLPRCPEPAAIQYAERTGIPFKRVFKKLRKERSFQGSTPEDRKNSIDTNLCLVSEIDEIPTEEFLQGKRIIVIDDSIVRGNNSSKGRDLLYKAGVEIIHFLSYTPRIGIIGDDELPRGCLYGVDMPPNDNFVSRDGISMKNRTPEEISEKMGMQVSYISLEKMLQTYEKLKMSRENLCTYCIGGCSPLRK